MVAGWGGLPRGGCRSWLRGGCRPQCTILTTLLSQFATRRRSKYKKLASASFQSAPATDISSVGIRPVSVVNENKTEPESNLLGEVGGEQSNVSSEQCAKDSEGSWEEEEHEKLEPSPAQVQERPDSGEPNANGPMRMDGESLHSLNGILDDFFSPSSSTSVKNETSFESDQKSNSTSYPGEEDDDTITVVTNEDSYSGTNSTAGRSSATPSYYNNSRFTDQRSVYVDDVIQQSLHTWNSLPTDDCEEESWVETVLNKFTKGKGMFIRGDDMSEEKSNDGGSKTSGGGDDNATNVSSVRSVAKYNFM